MNKLKTNKAFTIVELIVVIAIIAILVLLGTPKIQGYVDKAKLARIQHDVRVMENEMENALATTSEYGEFKDNGKDLGLLIEANRLFEKEGYADNLEYVPVKGEVGDVFKRGDKTAHSEPNKLNNGLGVGGPVVLESGGRGRIQGVI